MFCNIFLIIFDDWDAEKGIKMLSCFLFTVDCCVLLGFVLVRLYDSELVGIICNGGLERFLEVV